MTVASGQWSERARQWLPPTWDPEREAGRREGRRAWNERPAGRGTRGGTGPPFLSGSHATARSLDLACTLGHAWGHCGRLPQASPGMGTQPAALGPASRRGSLSAPQGSVSAEGLGWAGRVGSPSLQRSGSPCVRPGRWLARAKLIHNDLCLPLPGNG